MKQWEMMLSNLKEVKAEGCSFPGCGGGPDWCNAEDNGDCPGCGKAEDWDEEAEHDD